MPTRSKNVKIKCSRCQRTRDGLQILDNQGQVISTSGFYNMQYFQFFKQSSDESLVCSECMWSCEKYIERYGLLLTF